MSEASLDFDDSGLAGMDKAPERVRKDILASWGSFMLRQTRERFRRQVSPEGRVWPPTRFGSSASRGRSFFRTLYGRGDLFRSIVHYIIDKFTVGVGTSLIYARVHQEGAEFTATARQSVWLFHNVFKPAFGEDAPWSWHYHIKIPQRKFLGFAETDIATLKVIAAAHLQKGLASG